jgi:tetratricopeptide (TPR) repeat protein
MNVMTRLSVWMLAQALLASAALAASPARAAADCGPAEFQDERLDVNSPSDQLRISQVEFNHLNANVENLVSGMTGSVGGDLDFVVRYSPNHHRALAALVRLALRDKSPQPYGVRLPVECYLLRALEFTPSDPEVLKIYGTYLSRLGRNAEALARFEQAEKHAPDDPLIAYNIGLVLVETRDFERARTYAKKAYAAGVEFPGLRDKLTRQGQWR